MLRRSLRLQEAGYYTEEGTPSISYKEILYKVFWRRKHLHCGDHNMDSVNYDESVGDHHDFIDDYRHLDDYQDVACEQESTRINSNNNDTPDISASTIGMEATQTWTPETCTTRTQATHASNTRTQATQTSNPYLRTTGTQTNHISTTGTQTAATWTQINHTRIAGTQTILARRNSKRKARKTSSVSMKIISRFLLLLLLGFGFTHMHAHIRELQQEQQSLTQRLNMFVPLADTKPNYALKSQGARVWSSLSSDTYTPHIGIWNRIFSWRYSLERQQEVIQGHSLHPGECWPFPGDRGHLFISLSHPVSITHVTLGHITKSQSYNGYITSAPREFSVYGMTDMDEEGTYLGTLVYDQDGGAFQTFKLPNADEGVFRHVKLQIENNWGNPDYTCLYSFMVHGNLPD